MTTDFVESTRVESRLVSGVSFTVNHATERRRRALRASLAPVTAKLRRLVVRLARFEEDFAEQVKDGQKPTEEERDAYAAVREQLDDLQVEEVDPIWIKWCISDVTGLTIRGRAAVMEDLDDFPSPLYREMLVYAQREASIGGLDEKNSKSPSTSSGQVDGESLASTATAAAKPTDTKPETATATSATPA